MNRSPMRVVVVVLLRLFPRRFRDRYGDELIATFEDRLTAEPSRIRRAALAFGWAADMVMSAVGERKDTVLARSTPVAAAGPDVTVEVIPPRELKPLTHDQLQVSRRQFLNRAWTLSFLGFLGFFGMSSLSFLWPKLTGGFGTRIKAGKYDEIMAAVGSSGGYLPLFNPEGRFYLVFYGGTGDASVYESVNATKYQLLALYRKCVHLGCSVPHCSTSMLFECPCHGSKYRLTGEHYEGPAPRGMDRFPVVVEEGQVIVDTSQLQVGPPRGTVTWDQFAGPKGSFCQPRAKK